MVCLKGKSALVVFDRYTNLKYKFRNRHFEMRDICERMNCY